MKILRTGGVNPNTSRFLDLLENEHITNIDFAILEQELPYFEDLKFVAKYYNKEHLLKKINIIPIHQSKIQKFMVRVGRMLHSRILIALNYIDFLPLKCIDYDFIWLGDNDFDGSNHIFIAVKYFFKKSIIIRSYKETRFIQKWDEGIMLKESSVLIFPHDRYIPFFQKLYNMELQSYVIADLDWRYSKLIEWVQSQNVEKLSESDKQPHVCILTGRALSDPSEERSGHRYYFIPLINELIKHGIVVHLHAKHIHPSNSENAYLEIQKGTGMLHVEKALNLQPGSEDYLCLKAYDAGILHPSTPIDDIKLAEFQKINIPNRIYEYFLAGVLPLSERNSTPAAEKLIQDNEFGIIYDSYQDLYEKLIMEINDPDKKKVPLNNNSFLDFSHELIDAYKTVREVNNEK
ncbi:MAG: glycosyltransferase [Sphaerochaeta sp.]|nr:glycosyltransferase [Sphaerochaeta sp.]